MYNLISSIFFYKNNLAIGKNNGKDLLVRLKTDLKFFKNVTKNNIVIMGSKTYNSLPNFLEDRINIVLTRNQSLLKLTNKNLLKNLDDLKEGLFFLKLKDLEKIKTKKTKYVIGGEEIFNLFLKDYSSQIDKIYFTQIKGYKKEQGEPDRFISLENFSNNYKLISISEKYIEKSIEYRVLTYKNYNKPMSEEYKYIEQMNTVLETGKERIDRT
jgi:dihydrofolate reductase